jgi:hypothetical protein
MKWIAAHQRLLWGVEQLPPCNFFQGRTDHQAGESRQRYCQLVIFGFLLGGFRGGLYANGGAADLAADLVAFFATVADLAICRIAQFVRPNAFNSCRWAHRRELHVAVDDGEADGQRSRGKLLARAQIDIDLREPSRVHVVRFLDTITDCAQTGCRQKSRRTSSRSGEGTMKAILPTRAALGVLAATPASAAKCMVRSAKNANGPRLKRDRSARPAPTRAMAPAAGAMQASSFHNQPFTRRAAGRRSSLLVQSLQPFLWPVRFLLSPGRRISSKEAISIGFM